MENIRYSLNGMRMDFEIRDVPIGFVNALRRILLAEIPAVTVTNVNIVKNTTQLTHEMLRHRMEMLPINVKPEEADVVRDTKLELLFSASPEAREITTHDFVVTGPRDNVILKDRDLNTDLYFMKLGPNESLHIKANIGMDLGGAVGSQVCVATFRNHVDPDQAAADRDLFLTDAINKLPQEMREALKDDEINRLQQEAGRVFDNFYVQRSFHKGEDGRADWFDFTIESIGVVPAAELLRKAVEVLQAKILEWVRLPILREDAGWYRLEQDGETFTIGQLVQEMIYKSAIADFVSRDIGHPLTPKLVVRFHTPAQPETVIEDFHRGAIALCKSILKSV